MTAWDAERISSEPWYRLHWKRFKKQLFMQVFVLLGIAFLLVFKYIPMVGIIVAFKDYSIVDGLKGMFTSEWVGMKYFVEFVTDYKFDTIVRNTIAISMLKLIFSFPLPILLAILLNEIRGQFMKRFVQTVTYLPHFISWIIVSGMVVIFAGTQDGIINNILMKIGLIDSGISFLSDPGWFWQVAVTSDIWKETGWWAIIFIAALAGVDPALYEAADIDGASRLKKIWHITLPGIKGAIVVVLILGLGNLFGGGLSGSNFEQSYLLGNTANIDRSEIIETYVLKVGLAEWRFSYAAAIDLIQSVIAVILIFGSNYTARRITGNSLY